MDSAGLCGFSRDFGEDAVQNSCLGKNCKGSAREKKNGGDARRRAHRRDRVGVGGGGAGVEVAVGDRLFGHCGADAENKRCECSFGWVRVRRKGGAKRRRACRPKECGTPVEKGPVRPDLTWGSASSTLQCRGRWRTGWSTACVRGGSQSSFPYGRSGSCRAR